MVQAMSEWRLRQTIAQTRGHTIERQADGLRIELVRLASGEGDLAHCQLLIEGMRSQLELAEALVRDLTRDS